MNVANPIIDRLKRTRSFEHRGRSYPVGRATPFVICEKYYDLIVERGFKDILEIGTLYGQSTLYLAEAASKTGGRVTTIDLQQETRVWIDQAEIVNIHEVAEAFIRDSGLDEFVTFIGANSNEVMPQMIDEGKRFDFILIDGGHVYPTALLDFINADRLMRKAGIIAMDDIGVRIAGKPEYLGGPNRILPMIFSCGRYRITPVNQNVVLCEKLADP